MTLNVDIIKSVNEGSVTIDDKPLTDYSERELDGIRRKVANYIRKNPINANDLAYIIKFTVMANGSYPDDYRIRTITL